MKKSIFYILISFSLVLLSCLDTNSSIVIFHADGTDYITKGNAKWQFENDELVGSADSTAGFVMTKSSYDNFILELEFKPDSTINSGVFIRCKNKELSNVDCYEINIWDLHPNQENRTGAIVGRVMPMKKIETLDQWNTYKIKNDKDLLQVWINGILVVDNKDHDLTEGPIALQAAERGEIRFRNIRLSRLN